MTLRLILEHDPATGWSGWSNVMEAEVLLVDRASGQITRVIAPVFPALDGPPAVDGTAQRAAAGR